jgi:hypothetical protein
MNIRVVALFDCFTEIILICNKLAISNVILD